MKKFGLLLIIGTITLGIHSAEAQCSICTKTAGQLGEKRAGSLNTGIVYLMLTPFAIAGFVGYRWWRGEQALNKEEGIQ